jgi:RND family efflux transporter MFP subunit
VPVSWVSAHWRIPASIAALFVVAFAGGGWLYWMTHDVSSVHYATQKMELGEIVRSVTGTGVIVPTSSEPIAARVPGVILALYCPTDTKVTAGQLCAKIDPHSYQNAMNQNRADLAAAETRLERNKFESTRAKASFDRDATLAKRRAISRKSLERSRARYDRALTQTTFETAAVAQLEGALDKSKNEVSETDIIAPIDGTIVARNIEIGQVVSSKEDAPPLFRIAADLRVVDVNANVSETEAGEIKLGDKATFSVKGFPNHSFSGDVTQIGPLSQSVNDVASHDIVITASNSELLLEPGASASISVVVDRRDNVLIAPDQALRYSPTGYKVSTNKSGVGSPPADGSKLWMMRDGKPTAVPVQLGLGDGAYTEIVKGDAQPGDELIVGEAVAKTSQ